MSINTHDLPEESTQLTAVQEAALEETIVPSVPMRRTVIVLAVVGVGIVALTTYVASTTQNVRWALAFSLVAVVVVSLAFLYERVRLSRTFPRRLLLQGGVLTVSTPRRERKCELRDCWWFEGTTYDDRASYAFGKREAIVLVIPPRIATLTSADAWNPRYTPDLGGAFACGVTEETFSKWKAILRIRGIDQETRARLHRRIQQRMICNVCQTRTMHRLEIPFLVFGGVVLRWHCGSCGQEKQL